MNRHALLYTRALAALALAGCGSSLPQPETPTPVQSVAAPVLSAAGDSAVITLAVYPARLPEFVGQATFLEPVLQTLVDQYAADAAVFDAWVGDATRNYREGEVGSVLHWPGLDLTRPIFFRVGEAPDELQGALAVLSGASSPLRHVLACPATDAAALQAHFESLFANCPVSGGMRQCRRHQVQIVHNAEWVFVVRHEGPMPALSAADLMAPADPLAEWAYENGPVAGYLRPQSIRGVGAHLGSARAADALSEASGDSVNLMRWIAASEVVGAYLQSSPYGMEAEGFAFVVQPSPLSLSFRASLSQAGAHYSQTPRGEAARGGNTETGIVIRSSYALNALLAPHHPFGYGTDEREINEAMRRCGVACSIRAAFEPSAYLPFLVDAQGPSAALSAIAELEVDPALEAGTLDIDADTSSIQGARAGARLFARSRIAERSWSGGVSFVAEAASEALALARSAPELPLVPDAGASEASLRCLDALGQHVTLSLSSLADAPNSGAEARPSVYLRAAELSRCASDPAHAADRDAYLAALDVGFGA
ncbi:MAG: hypothetical protein AB8H86_06865 [Polyangiales bacterium]